MRRAIAQRMTASKQQAPHFYESADIEMDALLALLAAHNGGREKDDRASVTAALVVALAAALRAHPAFNAVWNGEELELVDAVNVGIAVELPDGLIAPALLNCGGLDIDTAAAALRDLVTRSRAKRLRAVELTDATFTLSNLGMFPIDSFTAIVVPPQVAILATARASERAVVRDGAVTVRRVMTATLSADHRAVDGAAAARFLADLKGSLEQPAALFEARPPEAVPKS
ncbi:MAG TPA: 2-oxo acid dehydrogenase subunit E2 [Candidatus Limnocylindrales bacterium]|nr:2-oxo acid dehydrogenase subunit E2 [Candidatus Limnocylindrales bacterium]